MSKEKHNASNELAYQREDILYELEGLDEISSLVKTEDNEIIAVQADPLQGKATRVTIPLEIAPEFVTKLRDYYRAKLNELKI
jgi:hypothetical protein